MITLIQRNGMGHYVVVGGVERNRVHFHDPIDGARVLKMREWVESWQDVDVFGTQYHRFGIVAYP